MFSDQSEFVGLVAAALTTGSFFPQVVRTRRLGGHDLSYAMLAIFLVGLLLWTVYGLMTSSIAVVIANSLTGLQVLAIMIMKRAHVLRAESPR